VSEPIFDLIIKHTKRNHLVSEHVCTGNDDRIDICEYVEALKGAGDSLGHDLPRKVGYVDAMAGVTLRIKYIG